jgi:hypothetical protein
MTKKNVNISEKLLSSLFIGFVVSILFVFVAHLFPKKWSFMPETDGTGYYTGASKVSYCSYQCVLGGGHSGNCENMGPYDVGNQTLGFGDILKATFDGHNSLILMMGLIVSIIIYILKKYNFNIVEE